MKNKKRLIIFTLTTSILLSGCSLTKENQYQEQMIISSETQTIEEDTVSFFYVNIPTSEIEKEKLIEFMNSLTGENVIVVFEKTEVEDLDTSLSYCEDIFETALKENPMIQIYYHGNETVQKKEESTVFLYPNVTYIKENEEVTEVIKNSYKGNKVCSNIILKYREGKEKVENFDLEESIVSTKEKIKDINTEELLDGLDKFNQYVQNTKLFKACENVSDKTMDALKPYVASALPKVQNAWKSMQPYIEKGTDKVGEIYEEVKPELKETYEKTKEKVKSLFEKKE